MTTLKSEALIVPGRDKDARLVAGTVAAFAAVGAAIHLIANVLGGYGYFRDELYYLACSRHLAAGYVDQPPLSVFLLAAGRHLFGESVFAIRLVPALLSGASIWVLGGLVRRMGGGRLAVALASLAFIAAPQLLASHSYFSMNCLDVFLWLLAFHALFVVAERRDLRAWSWLGVVLGLGLLNKTSMLWLGAGIGVATLMSGRLRDQPRETGPYIAAGIALVLFAPFVIWNAAHGWPHLEFIRNATATKYAGLTRGRFVTEQILAMNPFAWLLAGIGLVWCLTREQGRWRFVGITFLSVFAILLANRHTKAEYMAAAYPMLFACGGVAVERMRTGWRRGVVWSLVPLLVAFGALTAPLAMPLLPVDTYIRYSRALGIAPKSSEAKELSDLPQFFADMHGWEDLARDVSAAYLTIPEPERRTTVAFVTNYGEAGALQLFARKYPLPRVICNHNAYWFWGVGPTPITTFIRLGGTPGDYAESYESARQVGVHRSAHAMPYENNLSIIIARNRRIPIEKEWPELKHFE